MTIAVIKLGGSLAESNVIRAALKSVRMTKQQCVVVPGGGHFADAVREAQRAHHFSDQAAHHMALMAMRTMARMLVDLVPGYEMVNDEPAMHNCWAREMTPMWCPEQMVLSATDISESWDVTSDSLAAWLAARLRAQKLWVVKSCAVPPDIQRDANQLILTGIVDPAFARYVRDLPCDWEVVPLETWTVDFKNGAQ